MGIRGLMTYVNHIPDALVPYELHGGYLIIDGHCLACQLYRSSGCNCAFGGDHDRYAHVVAKFFEDLRKCNVTPLVILDGGTDTKKLKTMFERIKEKLRCAPNYTPATQDSFNIMPLIMMIIFNSVLKQRKIKLVRCILEADPAIAGVAKALNCPVLSFDSDFFIFGVTYIPLNTLQPFIVKLSSGSGYAKHCKIYRPENFLKCFPGLRASVLPLAAILLGNDYVKTKFFKNFYDCLKLSSQNNRLYSEEQRKIDTTFRWLQNYNLNDAVAAVLSKLPKKHRPRVLKIIELVIDGYSSLPCGMLVPLGFVAEYNKEIYAKRGYKIFKFQGNVENLESRQLWREEPSRSTSDSTSSNEESEEELISDMKNDEKFSKTNEVSDDTISASWPPWFSYHTSIADFPFYFVDMMYRRFFAVPVQIEDFTYPSANEMSLKIVSVIDGLLVAGSKDAEVGLLYIIRDGTHFVRHRVETVLSTTSTKFPALKKLRDTPMSVRRKIIDDTLEISGKEEKIDKIPGEWRLYVAAILYWFNQTNEPLRNSCHLYAVLFTMLLGIVDRKIGSFCRSIRECNKLLAKSSPEIEVEGKNKITKEVTKIDSIDEAIEDVTKNDCIIAAPFFVNNYTMDPQLKECPRKFNPTIVHVFSQFQCCMRHAIHLNALLGYPYEYPKVACLYNGTMLYNLYVNFDKRNDVETYIALTLEKSPTLFRVLKMLIELVKDINGEEIVAGERLRRKGKDTKRRRNKKKKKTQDYEESDMIEVEDDIGETQSVYSDPKNLFSVLCSAKR